MLKNVGDGERRHFQRFTRPHAEKFPVERTLGRKEGDFLALMLDFHATRSRDEDEMSRLAMEASFDEGSSVDGITGLEIYAGEGLEGPQ